MSVVDTSSTGPQSEVTDEHFFDSACDEINRIHAEYLAGLLELNDDQRMIFDEIGRMLATYRFGDGDLRQVRLIDVSRQMRELLSIDEATTVIPVFVAGPEPEVAAAAPVEALPVDPDRGEVPIRALPSLKTPEEVAARDERGEATLFQTRLQNVIEERNEARSGPVYRNLPAPDAPVTDAAPISPLESVASSTPPVPEQVVPPVPVPVVAAAPVEAAAPARSESAPASPPEKSARRPSRLPVIVIASMVGICGGLGYTTYKDMNSVAKWKSADAAQVAFNTQIQPDVATVEKDLSGVSSEVKSLNSAIIALQAQVPSGDKESSQLRDMVTAADDESLGLEQCVASTIGLQTSFADSLTSSDASTVPGFATAVAHVETTCDQAIKDDQILQADLPNG